MGCIGKSAHICEGRNHVAVFFFFIHCCLNYLIALKERRLIAKLKHADLVLSRDLIMKICWAAFSDIWSIRFISSREVCESCSSRSAFSCRFTSMYSRFKKRTTKPKSTLKTQKPNHKPQSASLTINYPPRPNHLADGFGFITGKLPWLLEIRLASTYVDT